MSTKAPAKPPRRKPAAAKPGANQFVAAEDEIEMGGRVVRITNPSASHEE